MHRRLKFVLLLGLCVGLTGCLGTADGYGMVKGRIADHGNQSHEGCVVELLIPPNWEVFDERKLSNYEVGGGQVFRAGFVIAPGRHPYKIRVGCATSEEVFTSPVIPLGAAVDPFEPVDLGVIVLPKKPIVAQ